MNNNLFQVRRELIDLITKCTPLKSNIRQIPIINEYMKDIKELVKENDENIKILFDVIMQRLTSSRQAIIKLKCAKLIDYYFSRSKEFRRLFLEQMKIFMNLCINIKNDKIIESKSKSIEDLRQYTLMMVDKWYQKYGQKTKYKVLQVAYRYLKNVLHLTFPSEISEQRQQIQQQRENRARSIILAKYDQIVNQWRSKKVEMEKTIFQCTNAFEVLLPSLDSVEYLQRLGVEDFDDDDDDDEFDDDEFDFDDDDDDDTLIAQWTKPTNSLRFDHLTFRQNLGINSSNYRVEVELNPNDISKNNIYNTVNNNMNKNNNGQEEKNVTSTNPILVSLHDSYLIISKEYQPLLKEWVRVLSRVTFDNNDTLQHHTLPYRDKILVEVLSIKNRLNTINDRFRKLDINSKNNNNRKKVRQPPLKKSRLK